MHSILRRIILSDEGCTGCAKGALKLLAVFNQVMVLFLLLITGYSIKKLKIIDDSLNRGLTDFLVYVALPALAISSMNFDFSKEILLNSAVLLAISIGIYAFSIVFSLLVPRILKAGKGAAGVYRFSIIFSNVGFMGYPVVESLYGREGVFYTVIYNLPFNILIWTLGVMIIGNGNREKIDYKNLMNPGIVAAVLGLILFLLSIKLPWPLYRSLEILGSTTTPLSMIVVGSILANMDARKMFRDLKVYWVSSIRLVLLPVVTLFILKLMGFEGLLVAIPVLITAMPAAANTAIMAEKYGGDSELASKVVFISTMFSLLTMPLIIGLV